VVKQYNYTRDDEEIYKEFLEIANELIPHMVRVVSAGGCEPSGMSAKPLLQDPECFAYLLRFYDGLCGWEEGSSTPVLHIGWAKPLVATIAKFPHYIRAKVDIKADINEENEEQEGHESGEDDDTDLKAAAKVETNTCDNNNHKNSNNNNNQTMNNKNNLHKTHSIDDSSKADVDESDVNSDASLWSVVVVNTSHTYCIRLYVLIDYLFGQPLGVGTD
jgi:menin